MKTLNQLFFISLILLAACAVNNTKKNPGLISPINLEAGKKITVLISDLFYAEEYNLSFKQNENLILHHNSVLNTLELTPVEGFSGIDLLEFEFDGGTFYMPFKLQPKQNILFTYKPEGKPDRINLFGQFNSWNRENLPMADNDGDRTYEIEVPLDPGRYEYKFFVDGAELIDNANPVKVPNGLGDFNSVIIIEPAAEEKLYLHNLNYEQTEDKNTFEFFYEGPNSNSLTHRNIIALAGNRKIEDKNISLNNGVVSVSLPRTHMDEDNTLRIVVKMNNKFSNIQTVWLENGIPVDNESPKTWYDAIIYSIMIDRFNDGDSTNNKPVEHPELSVKANYQGGDLQGILDKINEGYFDSLGINTFWLSPIVDNTNNAYKEYPPPHRYFTGYHGYWPISLEGVEEHFGDMNLTKKLINAAGNHGINILLDFVANHIHEEHSFWKEHRDWFGTLELPDGRQNLRLWDEHRLTTWFEPYMPSFDYAGSKEAVELMTDNAVWWLQETGAHGFRHDAVKHVPNEFWRLLTKKIKERIEIPNNTKVYQIGETFGGYDLISSYVSNGQLSAQFNFNLYDTAIPVFLKKENSFLLLDLQMQKTFQVYGVNHLMGNLLDSHDKIRYMAMADGDLEINDGRAKELGWTDPPKVDNPLSYDKLQLHLAYILTIPGVPVIYYGDEIGMTGAADPDNRRMMRFDDQLNNYEKETLKNVSSLIHFRKNHSALRYGDFYTLVAEENIYAYLRSDMNERVLVVLNKSEQEQVVNLPLPKIYNIIEASDLLSGKSFETQDDSIELTIPAIGFKILTLR